VSGLYEDPPHLIPDQTTESHHRHTAHMTKRTWRQVVVIYTLLVCAPLFFAYSNFRGHGGDAFSAVVQSVQGTYGIGRSTWFSTEWREEIASSVEEYVQLHLQLSYGKSPIESVITPRAYHRYRTTVERPSSAFYVDVDTNLSQSDFYYLYPELVQAVVNQFTTPRRGSLFGVLWTRVELLPYHVISHTWFAIFPGYDMIDVGGQCFLAAMKQFPGIPILAMLVLVPSWLALPTFWLWVVLSVLYVVLPPRAWGWMKHEAKRVWARVGHGGLHQ
jgi:hypothetical protein